MDKNDIIDYVMHTPHNTNKAVLSGMLNQLTEGSGGGGGGSSDFSTAEVTLNLTPPESVTINWSEVILSNGFYYDGIYYSAYAPREVVDNKTSIVLSNGGGTIDSITFDIDGHGYIVELSEATLSGDITFDSESYILIVTGDCTITANVVPIGG